MIIYQGIKRFRINKLFTKFIRAYHIRDRHFEYFRTKDDYKNSVIQLNDISKENKLMSIESSYVIKEQGIQTEEFLSHLLRRENVMKLSTSQLKDAMCTMANTKVDLMKYEDALKFIDEKCALSVDKWPLDLSLYMLDAWLIILGTKAFRKHYYFALSNLLNKKMKRCSKYDLLRAIYFIGLSKKSPPFLMELIQYKIEKFILDFSDEEWAIICLSFFKTSTKMNSDILMKRCCKAAENLMFKNDCFNLISVLKCLRLSEYYNADLTKMLVDYIEKEYRTFNFNECTNFLASFATENIYCFETYNLLESQGISELGKEDMVEEFNKDIEKIHPSKRSRMKDLARFLWGMAFVGHNMDKMSINFMVDLLNARINSGEVESDLPAFIDCVQSFILFGHYPLNLLDYVLKPVSLQKVSYMEKAKPKYQLYFISRSAYIENYVTEVKRKNFMNHIPKNLQKEVIERKGFQDVLNYIYANLKERSFVYCYIMPHIMISGIVVATHCKENNPNKLITSTLLKLIEDGVVSKDIQNILHEDKTYTCIEILDPSVCNRGSTMPFGLMRTKIRQLQKLNINVITLSMEEINALIISEDHSCSKLHDLFM